MGAVVFVVLRVRFLVVGARYALLCVCRSLLRRRACVLLKQEAENESLPSSVRGRGRGTGT